MKRVYKYLFVFLGSMCICPLISNAECSYERQAELSKMASNVRFNYTYDVTADGLPKFTIHITNVTDDIYISDNWYNTYIGNSEFKAEALPGEQISYTIYSRDNNCLDEEILRQYVAIPHFNYYSMTPKCKQNPDFYLCQTWANTDNYTGEEVIDKIDQNNNTQEKNKEKEETLLNKIKNVIKEKVSTLELSGILISFIILITILVVKKVKK